MSTEKKAYMAAFGQAIIIGFSFLFIKLSLGFMSPTDVLTHRFLIASIVVIIFIVLKRKEFTIGLIDILKIMPLALLYPILFFGFQAFGLLYSTSIEGGIIGATAPVFTIIFATYFIKEKTTIMQNIMILISIVGVIYLTIMSNNGSSCFNVKGTVLLILSTIAISLFTVLVRKYTKEYSFREITSVIILSGTLCFLAMSIYESGGLGKFICTFSNYKDSTFLISMLYLGILSSYFTSILSNYALTHIEASKVSAITNIMPIIATISGVVALKEQFYFYHIVGISLTLIGVLGATYFGKRK